MALPIRLLLLSFLLSLLAIGAGADDRQLRFAPPPNVKFTVQSVSARTQYLGETRLSTDSTFKSYDCSLQKDRAGWKMLSTLTHCGMKRDSSFSDSLLRKVMVGLKTTMQIDSIGAAETIDGFQHLATRINALGDTSVVRQLTEILSPELMASKEIDEWNMWMSRLVGRPLRVGSVTNETSDIRLPDDAELLSFEFSFLLDTLSFQGKLYGRLMTYIDTDPLRLAKATNRSPQRMAQIFNMPDSAITILSEPISDYRMTSEIIFELETLLFASKKTEREIVLRQSSEPGRTVFSSLVETYQENYTYTKR